MGKKKNRQNSSSVVPIDPSESSDAAVVAKPARKTACPHLNKSVDPNALRKNFRGNGHLANRDCSECKKQNISSVVEDIWLCLRCGSCSCGPEGKNHGLAHFEKPRSDSHSLAVKLETSVVWCYDCKVEVPAECSQKLHNSIQIIKQLRDTKKLAGPIVKKSNNNSQDSNQNVTTVNGQLKNNFKISSPNKQTSLSACAKIKGLTNLGNTCFFNSVLQCLAQTPGLIKILQEMQEPGQTFELHLDDGDTLKGELCKGGPVSESLLELLTDMNKSESGNGVLVPRKLLAAFRKKCPQFEDGDQNDAHELLRHLLDVVHTEDLRRYQRIILEANGLQSSVNPVEVAEDKKKRVKRLNQKVSEAVTIRPDQIFKGTLVSQLQCQTCSHKSDCLESFLDLSLPVITEKQPVPPVVTRRKNQIVNKTEEFNSVGPESDQTHKCLSKRKRRIVRKRFDNVYNQHREDGQGEPSITEEDKKASSDADVEDNDEIGTDDRKAEITESGYCSDKLTNSPTETHDVLEYPNSLNELVPDSTTVTQKLSELKLEEPCPVQQDDKLTQKLSELKLEEPPVQQLDDKQNLYLLRPESGLGSSIVSVQESNVSVLGPTELTHSIDSSDSIKGNPSFTSRDLSTESLPEIGLPSRDDSVSSEHDDNNTAQVCDSLSGSCFTDRILQQDYDPDATDVEVKTSIINDEDTKQGVVISDCQEELLDINNELSIINQKGKSSTRLEYSNQVARSSPVEIACNHILDSNLLSKSLESYKTECLSSVQNSSVDITGTSEMSLVHVGERNVNNSENKSCVEETNQEMGFVLVGGITSSANCDLSVSVSKSVGVESCSKKQNGTRPASGCSKPNIVVSNGNGNDEESDVVNPELYRHRHITLAPRYQCFEGECSVLSCLNNFTAIEMMAGNNKVGCEACTQRQNKGCKDKEAKTVYRLSTKRLLISSPPQVLILHLKRFQVHQYSFKKLNCHVSFPLVLDIAPFCSHSVQKLLHPGQTQLLYSLYGIVSHSGTLRCGHYVAYVKVRTGPSEHGNPSPGKWFYVSDSHTREISVEAVLNTQAYLLFYERIE